MNKRAVGVEWQHPELPLKLWIHPGSAFGRLAIVRRAMMQLGDSTPDEWWTLFFYANAYVIDYEWSGEDSHPVVDYLDSRSVIDVLSTFDDFLMLDFQDAWIFFLAFSATHPSQVQRAIEPDSTDETAKKKSSGNAGLENPDSEPKPETETETVPTG